MNVYVLLIDHDDEPSTVVGVFSSKENAEIHMTPLADGLNSYSLGVFELDKANG